VRVIFPGEFSDGYEPGINYFKSNCFCISFMIKPYVKSKVTVERTMKKFLHLNFAIILFLTTIAMLCSIPQRPVDHPTNADVHLFIKNKAAVSGPIPVNQGDSVVIGLAVLSPGNFQNVNYASRCNSHKTSMIIDSRKSADTAYYPVRFSSAGTCTVVADAALKEAQYKNKTDTLIFTIKSNQSTDSKPSVRFTSIPPSQMVKAGVTDTMVFTINCNDPTTTLDFATITTFPYIGVPQIYPEYSKAKDTLRIILNTSAADTYTLKVKARAANGLVSDEITVNIKVFSGS
jgi:hypothetical protein